MAQCLRRLCSTTLQTRQACKMTIPSEPRPAQQRGNVLHKHQRSRARHQYWLDGLWHCCTMFLTILLR